MITRNIGNRDDGAYNTNAPFADDGELRIGDSIIPQGSVLHIFIQCASDTVLPVRLYSIKPVLSNPYECDVVFADNSGNELGTCRVSKSDRSSPYCSSVIRDASGLFVGYMFYYPQLSPILVAACTTAGETVRTEPGSFVLLPGCCRAHKSSGARGVHVNGVLCYGNTVNIVPGDYMRAEVSSISSEPDIKNIEYGFIGAYEDREQKNGICWLSVNGVRYWAAGANLIIRSTVTSNIRVTGSVGNVNLEIVH